MVAAGNAIVFNPHPGGAKSAVLATREYNKAIARELGIENLICVIENPSLESFEKISKHELIAIMAITGGPAVVNAAMQSGKRSICAGPGNPVVVVDETADLDRAARCVIEGGAFDNNLLCIGEKEVFVVQSVFDQMMEAMSRAGAMRLNDFSTLGALDDRDRLGDSRNALFREDELDGRALGLFADRHVIDHHAIGLFA